MRKNTLKDAREQIHYSKIVNLSQSQSFIFISCTNFTLPKWNKWNKNKVILFFFFFFFFGGTC
jgi:hypothetical protein